MGLLRYWGLVVKVAFTHALTPAQDFIFLMLVIAGGFAIWAPQIRMPVDVSSGEVALVVLGSILVIRLFLAPYWIYQEQQTTLVGLNKRLTSKITKRQVREELGKFLEEGKKILVKVHYGSELPFAECETWDNTVKIWLEENLDSSFKARFTAPLGSPEAAPRGIGSEEGRMMWSGVRFRMDRLTQFIEEPEG